MKSRAVRVGGSVTESRKTRQEADNLFGAFVVFSFPAVFSSYLVFQHVLLSNGNTSDSAGLVRACAAACVLF